VTEQCRRRTNAGLERRYPSIRQSRKEGRQGRQEEGEKSTRRTSFQQHQDSFLANGSATVKICREERGIERVMIRGEAGHSEVLNHAIESKKLMSNVKIEGKKIVADPPGR